jgi:hypothetical protein
MMRKIVLSLLGFLMIAGGFNEGCEEEEPKPDYITVNVTTKGIVRSKKVGSSILMCYQPLQSLTVRVDVIKAGGERFNLFAETGMDCDFQTESVSFKLYREQPIEIKAYSEQVPGGVTQVEGTDYLSWDEVYPQFDFGETYNYTSDVTVLWLEDS